MIGDDGYQAGDDITLTLLVAPEDGVSTDGTTTATVQAVCDDGTVQTPTAIPDAERARWHATLQAAGAGEWQITWTVTGTGSGVRSYRLVVAAIPPAPPTGRSYATVAELSTYTEEEPPAGAAKLLRRATRKVDELLRCAVYPVDEHGMPRHLDACLPDLDAPGCLVVVLRDATCAQVEWWGETGDEAGTGAVAALAGAQIGTVRLPGGGGGAGGSTSLEYAPDAVTILAAAGLTNQGPRIPGPPRLGEILRQSS